MFTILKNRPLAKTLAASVVSLLCVSTAFAQGGTDIDCVFDHGTGTITDLSGGTLIEVDTTTAILTCTNFDVFSGGFVDFVQQNATDRVLAQVTGGQSTINGDLNANGIVFIANPNGIFFGSEAVVDAAGLFAVSGSIVDTDFINGVNRFTTAVVNGSGSGEVDNAGSITADAVHLIGRIVRNSGSIDVGNGVVTMVSGSVVTITESGPGNRVTVAIDTSGLPPTDGQWGVEHTDDGSIDADGGQVILGAGDLYSLAVTSAGEINAPNGTVEMSANEGSVFHDDQGGVINANGGDVTLISQSGNVFNQGDINAANGNVDMQAVDGAVFNDPGFAADVNAAGGSVTMTASGLVSQNGTMTADDVSITAGGNAEIGGGSITADTIFLHAGTSGTGDLIFGSPAAGTENIFLNGFDITLRAGDGAGGAGTTSAINLDRSGTGFVVVSFNDPSGESSPNSFTFRQDAAIADTDLPLASRFGGSLAGLDYTIRSDDGSVTIATGSRVAGTNLDVLAGTDFILDTEISLASLTATANTLGGGGLIEIDAANVTTTGGQTYNSATEIAQDVTFDGTNIAFNGTLDSQIANFDLVVNDDGNTVFGDTVGGTLAFGSITTDAGGTTEFAGNTINTTGDQTYNDPLFIREDTTINAVNATFQQINSATTTHRSLTVNASGITQFDGSIGTLEALFALTTDAAGITNINAGDVVTLGSGDQVYNDPVFLQSDTTLTAENVTFNSTVDTGDADPASLTINASDATIFNDIVGGTSALANLLTDAPGTLAVNTAEIITTGNQTYNDAMTIGNDVTFYGNDVTFGGTVDGTTAGAESVIVQGPLGGADGNATVLGEVGGNTPLDTFTVRGSSTLAGDVTTTGEQEYQGDATVVGDSTLDGSLVRFEEDVLGDDGGDLTIVNNVEFGDAADDGDIVDGFDNLTVGGTSLMNVDSVTTNQTQNYNGNVTLVRDGQFTGTTVAFNEDLLAGGFDVTITGGAVLGDAADDRILNLNNLLINGTGNTFVSSNEVTAAGDQSYGNAVFLREDTTLTANNVSFLSTIDSATSTHRSLIVNATGLTLFDGIVGGLEPLFALTTDAPGNTTISTSAMTAMGSGDFVFNDPVLLDQDTTLTAENVTFNNTLDSFSDSNPAGLTIDSSVTTTFNDLVGSISPLAFLMTNSAGGTTFMDGGSIETVLDQDYNDPVVLRQDTTLIASSDGDITFNNTVDGTTVGQESLTLNGDVFFNGTVGGATALESVLANDFAFLNADITTTGTQVYRGDVGVGTSSTLDASLVRFEEDVNGDGGDITIVNNVQFGNAADDGDVVTGIDNLTVGGTTLVNADSITTNDTQTYNGDVTLTKDGQFTSTNIAFNEDVLANNNNITMNGNATLGDAADDRIQDLNNLQVNGHATINASSVQSSGNQDYNGRVNIGNDLVIDGNRVTFAQQINGGGNDLTVNALNTFFNGNVVNLNNLMTDAAGTTRISNNITVVNSINFGDVVVLTGDATLSQTGDANGGIFFEQDISGTQALVVRTNGNARFGGDVGTPLAPLSSFETLVDGTLIFDGNFVRAVNDILFNANLNRIAVPARATVGANGNLTISSATGDFTMGQNEKLTVHGNLNVNAETATLGDINTLGDMRINANAILLLTRDPGLIDDVDGGSFLDSGLDYVAGGEFFFNVTPILVGENPVGFANTDGDGDALGTLAGFDIGAFGQVTPAQLGDGDDGFFDLASRDLISAINIGIVYPGTPGLLLDEVPPESELEEVEQDTPIRPSELDELGRNLSIFGRLLSPAELAELTLGRSLYIDPPSTVLDMGRMRSEIVIQRMLYGSIADALETYQQLTGRGDRPITQIRDEMNDAYILYLTDLDEDADESAADFASQIQRDHPELHADIQVVNKLLRQVRIIGQTPAEVSEAETQLIEKLTPREMDQDMMRQVIEVMDGTEPTVADVESSDVEENTIDETSEVVEEETVEE